MTQYPQSGIPGPGPAYGQYPASGYGQPPAPPSERPRPLVIAVWLMYVAAAVEIVYAVGEGRWLGSYMSSLFTAIQAADPSGSSTPVPTNLIKNAVLSFISRPVVADGKKRALISFQMTASTAEKQHRTPAGKPKICARNERLRHLTLASFGE